MCLRDPVKDSHEVRAAEHIQVHGDLIQQQHLCVPGCAGHCRCLPSRVCAVWPHGCRRASSSCKHSSSAHAAPDSAASLTLKGRSRPTQICTRRRWPSDTWAQRGSVCLSRADLPMEDLLRNRSQLHHSLNWQGSCSARQRAGGQNWQAALRPHAPGACARIVPAALQAQQLCSQHNALCHSIPSHVSHLVHAPGWVDVQHLDQPLLARRVHALHRVDHAQSREVALRGG